MTATTTPITETADLLSIAEIRDYVTSAAHAPQAIADAVMHLIPDDLYSVLASTSERIHSVGLVGLSEDILRGREEPSAFLAVLDAHEAGR